MQEFLISNWQSIFGTVFGASGVLAYLNERKKTKIDAFGKMQEAYDKYVTDNNERFEVLQNLIEKQNEELELLRPLKFEVETLSKELHTFKMLYEKEKQKNALCERCKSDL